MITRKSCINDAPARADAAGAFAVIFRGCKRSAAVLLSVLIVLIPALYQSLDAAYADDSYMTDSFDVVIDVTENHVIKYDETITVDFFSPHHGIYRYIPVQKKFYDVNDISVYGADYDTDFEYTGDGNNGSYGNQILQIGDPYRTFTGQKIYEIKYSLVCTKDEDDDKDYLSMDLLPTGWTTPISSAEVRMKLPKEVDWDDIRLYSGTAGKSEELDSSKYRVTFSDDGMTLILEARNLEQGEGVTLQGELPEGYWKGVTSRRMFGIFAYVIPMLMALLMFVLWLFNGRDPSVIKPVEFYPPDGITPAEVGYIVDGNIDDKDISSMLIYFASKGYLEIREKKKDEGKYELVKKKDIPDTEPVFAVRLFGGIFPYEKAVEGREQTADLDDLPAGFSDAVKVAKDELKSMYDSGKRRMFTMTSKAARDLGRFICSLILPATILIVAYTQYRLLGLFSAAFPFLFVLIGVLLITASYDNRHSSARVSSIAKFTAGIVVAGVGCLITFGLTIAMKAHITVPIVATIALAASIFFQVFMWARTKENAAIYGKILGFRDFIDTAELQRLKALSDENPEYYYDIMPYAMVMGMSVKWAKKFEKLNVPEPEWYAGTRGGDVYNAMWYSNVMNSTASQFAHAPSVADAIDSGGFFTGSGGSFSGGGFGGGSFSGGGFGGGGGGAW